MLYTNYNFSQKLLNRQINQGKYFASNRTKGDILNKKRAHNKNIKFPINKWKRTKTI